jgi:transposase
MLMPAPYSTDLRQRVIDAYEANEGSQRQLAKRFKVSLSFVQRLIRLYENTGQVTRKHHGGGAIAKIQVEDLPLVQQLVSEQPDALLVELCERLALRRGLQVSVPTMHRTVEKLGLTTKKTAVSQRTR